MTGGVTIVRGEGGWGCDRSEGGVAGSVIIVTGEGGWGCDRSEGGG